MKTKSLYFLAFLTTLIAGACNKATPSGFWKNYDKNLLVTNISDQGPYGGHRAIHWKTGIPNTFTATGILDYAIKNGWALVDSSAFDEEQTAKWVCNDRAVFPLTSTGFSAKGANESRLDYFPRWFGGRIKVYKFRTDWVTIEPGTDNTIDVNGFVVTNRNGTEMAVYHLWGE